jgi:hypothetical protein
MYNDRANLSDKPYHDITSQVILFYHVLHGWTTASQMCSQIIIKPTLNGLPLNLKEYRAHNNATPIQDNRVRHRDGGNLRLPTGNTSNQAEDVHRQVAATVNI